MFHLAAQVRLEFLSTSKHIEVYPYFKNRKFPMKMQGSKY